MNNSEQLQRLYSRLSRRDIEEFYAGYQLWLAEQRLAVLQAEIQALRQQIEQNAERLRQLQPPEGVLKLLTALREWGVNDSALLDRLCERGEAWLQAMFRRLDTCRRLGLFDGDYTRWCEHALEGAYDWLDSIEEGAALVTESSAPTDVAIPAAEGEESPDGGVTEDEFLRRLLQEEATAGHLPALAPAEVVAANGHESLPSPEQTAPAEVVPLPDEVARQMTEAGLTGRDDLAVAEAPESEGQPEALAEATEAQTPEGGEALAVEAELKQQTSAPPLEPALREYAGGELAAIAVAAEAGQGEAPDENEAQAVVASAAQAAEASPVNAYYEFSLSTASPQETASIAEELILPEGETPTESESAREEARLSGSADASVAGANRESEQPVDARAPEQIGAEMLNDSPAPAEQPETATLAEQPEASEQQAQPAESNGAADSRGTATVADQAVPSQQAEEEDTATELHFWQRIFGRHGLEFD